MANKQVEWLKAHRKEAGLGAAAVVVVFLGVRTARSRGAGAGAGAGQDGMPAPSGAAIGGYAAGQLSTTGEDVFYALQPQLAQNQSLMGQILDRLNGGGTSTAPPTKPTVDATGGVIGGVPTRGTTKVTGAVIGGTPTRGTTTVTKPPVAPTTKPGTPTRSYTVKKGDTLSGIGARYGVDWHRIYTANKSVIGLNPNLIRTGQVLRIP